MLAEDISGIVFGRLTALEFSHGARPNKTVRKETHG